MRVYVKQYDWKALLKLTVADMRKRGLPRPKNIHCISGLDKDLRPTLRVEFQYPLDMELKNQ